MKLLLAAVGRPRAPGLKRAIQDFEGRIGHYFNFEVREVGAERARGGAGARAAAVRRESERLLESVPEGFDVIAVDERGDAWTSEELARYLGELAVLGRAGAAFLIGGPFGHARDLRERARHVLALSRFTLPHELARLVLVEQIYRAGTILRGEPYHKGG